MSAICLIDTTIFVEILDVPMKATQHEQVLSELEAKIQNGETLFLPMAAILEAGNHVAQNGDGGQRRECANKFVIQVQQALNEQSPFKPISFLKPENLQQWLSEFPDSAMRGQGLGDLSILHDFNKICNQNPRRRVYVWSLDEHLSPLLQEGWIR
ncbi:MAG TPA: hypothetical protein PLY52_11410 [Methanothrix sp.]|jgi:hypothetical protein|uniref:hypothetical protein n=1 Tax=Methanothrix sp. TaxID=90426 RepID=UPI002BE162C0|nr:hypothetical protein [Methanothrix sp.]HON36899.1 hypothetical protein [Methanothrix sp.]HRU76485.1 hypothetical protein [Methanothrix sp.]